MEYLFRAIRKHRETLIGKKDVTIEIIIIIRPGLSDVYVKLKGKKGLVSERTSIDVHRTYMITL